MASDGKKAKGRLKAIEARLAALETAREAPAPPPPATTGWAGDALAAAGGEAAVLAADWRAAAPALAALGHPVRLTLLHAVLTGQARTAAELTALDGMGTTGQTYHHLRQLVAAGWLRAGARGVHEVPAARVVPLLVILAAAR